MSRADVRFRGSWGSAACCWAASARSRGRRAEAGRVLRVPPAGGLQARHPDQQPAAQGPRRRQGRRHRRRQQRPVADRPAPERQEARRRRRRPGRREPEANQVPSDRRMRLVSVPVNKEVVSLQAGDFNGDGKPDLAYYGTPAELVDPATTRASGRFGDVRSGSTSGEAVESGTALTVGDLNRDGRDDLALLGPNEVVARLPGREGEARRARAAAAHGGQPPDAPGRGPRRRRRRRPGDPRRRHRRPDPRPVLGRGGQARPRAAVPHRGPRGYRLRARSTASPAPSC